jgi:hypothetical protein
MFGLSVIRPKLPDIEAGRGIQTQSSVTANAPQTANECLVLQKQDPRLRSINAPQRTSQRIIATKSEAARGLTGTSVSLDKYLSRMSPISPQI